mmetsp:Transcript_54304/g.151165  ORF Transcript_54304/g.151165 Transcript_54304/m.151165 type:complete len:254 (-) Transcript_54304:1169-1930(-)
MGTRVVAPCRLLKRIGQLRMQVQKRLTERARTSRCHSRRARKKLKFVREAMQHEHAGQFLPQLVREQSLVKLRPCSRIPRPQLCREEGREVTSLSAAKYESVDVLPEPHGSNKTEVPHCEVAAPLAGHRAFYGLCLKERGGRCRELPLWRNPDEESTDILHQLLALQVPCEAPADKARILDSLGVLGTPWVTPAKVTRSTALLFQAKFEPVVQTSDDPSATLVPRGLTDEDMLEAAPASGGALEPDPPEFLAP